MNVSFQVVAAVFSVVVIFSFINTILAQYPLVALLAIEMLTGWVFLFSHKFRFCQFFGCLIVFLFWIGLFVFVCFSKGCFHYLDHYWIDGHATTSFIENCYKYQKTKEGCAKSTQNNTFQFVSFSFKHFEYSKNLVSNKTKSLRRDSIFQNKTLDTRKNKIFLSVWLNENRYKLF